MATKNTKKTLVSAAPPPPTDEQIIERFRSEANREQAKFDMLRDSFLTRVANSPTDAIEWQAAPLIQQEAEANEWKWAIKIVEAGGMPLAEIISAISVRARDEQRRILDLRPWEANSSAVFANAARMYGTSGRARALERIGVHAEIAAERLRERGEVEVEASAESTS